jgi:hypothetical protein
MSTFFIIGVEKNDFGKGLVLSLALEPKAISIAEPIVSDKDAWMLANHFGDRNIQKIVGKSFESELNDPLVALEYLVLGIKCGGCYVPPSCDEVRAKAAQALAKVKKPDFSKIDSGTVHQSFIEMWAGKLADTNKLVTFMKAVEKYSSNKTKLMWASLNDFPIRKSNAEYLQLIRVGQRSQKLIMRPDIPIEFVD